jgi:methionyl-tRNA formyltransferase
MRIIFMGTPALAVPCLEVLHAEHEIALVVTQPDKPARRGHHLTPPPVKQYALEHNLSVSQPERARNEEFVAQVRAMTPDAIAVVAYGQILPREILEAAPRGCINLHYSLLPRWRGAAPVQYAILNGDTATGVTTQWMAEQLDAGDVILQEEVAIEPEETSEELFQRLTPIGSAVLRDTLRLLERGEAPRTPQDESGVTFAPTIKKEAGAIDWHDTAANIVNKVRAFNPWPVAWCDYHGQPLRMWRARVADEAYDTDATPATVVHISPDAVTIASGNGAVDLIEVQAPNRPRMSATDWARGARVGEGSVMA